jgi:membrane protein required for beta-lactamase induction
VTTDLLARVPVDRITEEARQVHPGRTLLTVIAAILFGLGWLVAKAFGVTWFALVWAAVAVREGWREARPKQGPSPVR